MYPPYTAEYCTGACAFLLQIMVPSRLHGAGCGGTYLWFQLLGRQEDHLNLGVQDQSGQHSETPISLKQTNPKQKQQNIPKPNYLRISIVQHETKSFP
jgi:hypothetical protein